MKRRRSSANSSSAARCPRLGDRRRCPAHARNDWQSSSSGWVRIRSHSGDAIPLADRHRRGDEPLQARLTRFTQPEERQFFLSATTQIWPASARVDLKSDDLIIMLPAFVSSELTRAFEIGFPLYLPFLVVALIVSTVLMAMGMSMVQPTLISVPLKLLLFVAVAGWSRLMHGMILTYN
jgi:type III secretion protein R